MAEQAKELIRAEHAVRSPTCFRAGSDISLSGVGPSRQKTAISETLMNETTSCPYEKYETRLNIHYQQREVIDERARTAAAPTSDRTRRLAK
jgi:hypothetical protein